MPCQEQSQAKSRPRVLQAYGEWLSLYEWDWWTTLTFAQERRSNGAAFRALNRWIRGIDLDLWRQPHTAPYWFAATEMGAQTGRLHLHTLLGNVGNLARSFAWKQWFKQYGRASILPYDPRRGAGYYIAKYVSKDLSDYEVGGAWPTLTCSLGGSTPRDGG